MNEPIRIQGRYSWAELWCGDCREILPKILGVEFCFMDPPFGHGNQDGDLQSARVGLRGARQKEAEPIANDKEDCLPMMEEVFSVLPTSLNADCCCCCCCGGGGPSPTFAWFANRMDQKPWAFFHALVWDKSGRGNGMGWRYRRNYEFVMVSHLRGGKLLWAKDGVAVPNILRNQPPAIRKHPNEKPISMVLDLMQWHGGGLCLDPFLGAGTSGVAAARLHRPFIGIEIDPKWFAIAERRIRQELESQLI